MSVSVEFVRPATTRGFGADAEPVPEFRFYAVCEQVPAQGERLILGKDVLDPAMTKTEVEVTSVIWLMEDQGAHPVNGEVKRAAAQIAARVILR